MPLNHCTVLKRSMAFTADEYAEEWSDAPKVKVRARQRPLRRARVQSSVFSALSYPLPPQELKRVRTWLGFKQTDLAPLLGICAGQLGMYERGRAQVPGAIHERLNRLAMEHAYELVGQRAPEPEPLPAPPPAPRRGFWAWLLSLDL